MEGLAVGTVVRRNCPGIIGHNSIGTITSVSDSSTCYWVKIIEGRGQMKGWATDAWSVDWCEPVDFNIKPSWEI
jgi:hypothetical protein